MVQLLMEGSLRRYLLLMNKVDGHYLLTLQLLGAVLFRCRLKVRMPFVVTQRQDGAVVTVYSMAATGHVLPSCQSGVWKKTRGSGVNKWCGTLSETGRSYASFGQYYVFRFKANSPGVGFGVYEDGKFSGTWSGKDDGSYGCYNLPIMTAYSGQCSAVILDVPASLNAC